MSGVTVCKLGGPALEDPGLLAPLAAELQRTEGRVVLVHGGGRHVERLLKALGIESRFIEGRRETSPAAMEVVEQVLSGAVNKALAAGLTAAGVKAVGVSGRDGGMIRARLQPGLGRVGVPDAVDASLLRGLWDAGYVPVVSPVSSDAAGQAVNVNADEAALALARALGARTLLYFSDVDGVRVGERTVPLLTEKEAHKAVAEGAITGGMAMKVAAALDAAALGMDVVIAGRARLTGGFPGTRIATVEEAKR